jgi:hypothetical protein
LALNMAKVYLLLLVLCGFAQADQVNCIKWKDANGTVIGTYCRPFTVVAGNGIALSDNHAGAITISTDGSGAPGSGTVTSFSSGDLAPLFTTSVATASSTPALTFVMSAAAAHSFFGNCTGSSATPSYCQPAFSDLAGAATDAQIPDTITISLSATTTALAADGANCSGNNFALGVDASGAGQCAQPAFSNLSGTATDAQIPDNITVSLAATATALAANGANCAGNNFALGVDASGVGECAQPAFSNLSGTATDAQVPDNITISLAATATALAADPANCSAGSVAAGITAGGVAEGCAVFAVTKASVANQFLNSYTSGTGAFTSAQPAFTDISGAATDAQVPDNITVTLAATATALAANPADCTSGQFANAINASGTLTCATLDGQRDFDIHHYRSRIGRLSNNGHYSSHRHSDHRHD